MERKARADRQAIAQRDMARKGINTVEITKSELGVQLQGTDIIIEMKK